MTLPISRSRGRTVERTTSTTRLCFSSTTPVRTVNPKLKMPTRIRTAPMLATRKRAWSASVCGSSGRDRRRLLGIGQRPLVDVARAQHALDAERDGRRGDELRGPLVGLLLEADLARRRQVGRHVDDDVDAAVEGGACRRGLSDRS